VHLTSLCLIAQKLSAKKSSKCYGIESVALCCLVSIRNTFLRVQIFSISVIRFSLNELIVCFMSEWISSNEYTGHNCFFISIVAHSQSVLLRMRKLWS